MEWNKKHSIASLLSVVDRCGRTEAQLFEATDGDMGGDAAPNVLPFFSPTSTFMWWKWCKWWAPDPVTWAKCSSNSTSWTSATWCSCMSRISCNRRLPKLPKWVFVVVACCCCCFDFGTLWSMADTSRSRRFLASDEVLSTYLKMAAVRLGSWASIFFCCSRSMAHIKHSWLVTVESATGRSENKHSSLTKAPLNMVRIRWIPLPFLSSSSRNVVTFPFCNRYKVWLNRPSLVMK